MTRCRCGSFVRQDFELSTSCIRFDPTTGQQLPGGNDTWLCFTGCGDQVCVHCYMSHIESKHPKTYSTDCASCKQQTLYKDFAAYGVCRPCVDKQKPDESELTAS